MFKINNKSTRSTDVIHCSGVFIAYIQKVNAVREYENKLPILYSMQQKVFPLIITPCLFNLETLRYCAYRTAELKRRR